ncbi:ProQ/FINO family protein [Acidovorax sp. SUPP3334]|uniref:ProQ/FINO family protein n=1 Tax=Acidovorax sp. SUPP3334 TaxID=2920881 RepID=UPI0023DE40AA|nr:ProQ/FINO family protein [Acidovorax sp. SUPP3334]GKT25534.1 ProQ/FINO family protein [Acidovorax sp. SUPP3334]
MTDPVTAQEQQNNVPAPAPTAPAGTDAAATAPDTAAVQSPVSAEPAGGEAAQDTAPRGDRPASRRGGRNRRKPGGAGAPGTAPAAQAAPQNPKGAGPQGPRRTHPALEQLAALYPHLFGAQFLPLKRGIFQDLLAAHPEVFERDALKLALGIHTRSTRYLQAVAEGRQRHDLQGNAVEAMAPEHVHHALLEVFRRRKPRDGEDMTAKLRRRIALAYEASGLTREAYDTLVRGRDEAANALLDEAFAEVAERDAKAEALLRAFEASGSTVAQFADMYGMDPRTAERSLHRARQLRAAPAAAPAAAPQESDAPDAFDAPAASEGPVEA